MPRRVFLSRFAPSVAVAVAAARCRSTPRAYLSTKLSFASHKKGMRNTLRKHLLESAPPRSTPSLHYSYAPRERASACKTGSRRHVGLPPTTVSFCLSLSTRYYGTLQVRLFARSIVQTTRTVRGSPKHAPSSSPRHLSQPLSKHRRESKIAACGWTRARTSPPSHRRETPDSLQRYISIYLSICTNLCAREDAASATTLSAALIA